jgi:hypothetical protein
MYENEDRIVKTAVEARGGRLGRPVLVVLIVSTLAMIGNAVSSPKCNSAA